MGKHIITSFFRYLNTARYLKPFQILRYIWFHINKPKACNKPGLPVRKRTEMWIFPPHKCHSLYSSVRFRFLNEEHDILSPSDWNNPYFNKLGLYHLHYFDDLCTKGAGSRVDLHRALINRWIMENPIGAGIGWEPYPISRRIVNWISWAWCDNDLSPVMKESLTVQIRYLKKKIEWHILGNHIIANAKAMIFAGLFFEGKEAEVWLNLGGNILKEQFREQILPDGGHSERSPMYHAQVLEDILDILNALKTFPRCVFSGREEILVKCKIASNNMLYWLENMTHPDGEIALFNDSAIGGVVAPAELTAYAKRLNLLNRCDFVTRKCASDAMKLIHLESTGYIRVDCGKFVAFLDVAPIGPDYLAGHSHADTLSYELSYGRQRVIVDCGVSEYDEGPERLRQRGTAAHNTVEINGKNSSDVWAAFRVAQRARPFGLIIRKTEDEIVVSCSHDGYRRLAGMPVHRREWRFNENRIIIVDRIQGQFFNAVSRLHFHPSVNVEFYEDRHGYICLPDGKLFEWIVEGASASVISSTYHPEFGISIPNQCLELIFERPEIRFTLWGNLIKHIT